MPKSGDEFHIGIIIEKNEVNYKYNVIERNKFRKKRHSCFSIETTMGQTYLATFCTRNDKLKGWKRLVSMKE